LLHALANLLLFCCCALPPFLPVWCCCLQLFNSGYSLLQMAMFVQDRVSNALLPSFLTSAHSRAMP